MVGYREGDSLTQNQKFIAGVYSGIMTRAVTQPLDVIKLRIQLQPKKRTLTFVQITKSILKKEGPAAFFHGHFLGQVYSITAVSSQFYFYELSSMFFHKAQRTHDVPEPLVRFACGTFAGCCSSTLVNPLEVIRVRQMVISSQYGGLLRGARAVYRTGGFRAFYGGLLASMLQMGPQTGISFGIFSYIYPPILNYLNAWYMQHHPTELVTPQHYQMNHVIISSTLAGSISGFAGKTFTYPLDLAKRRLQMGTHKYDRSVYVPPTSRNMVRCKTLVRCIKKTVKVDGFQGLFKGWGVTIYKALITNIVAFTSYEAACFMLREANP